jgi:hypothetical protein
MQMECHYDSFKDYVLGAVSVLFLESSFIKISSVGCVCFFALHALHNVTIQIQA